jgi:nicotinamide-nucleotide amidase
MGRRLADLGRPVGRQETVPDTAESVKQAVLEAVSRADLVITTGGLGPTSDDITRDEIAAVFGTQLREDAETLSRIRRFFSERGRPVPGNVSIQAMVPDGATILTNSHGTAPGLAMPVPTALTGVPARKVWLVMLPGPPRELYPMFDAQVVSLLAREFPLESPHASVTLKTTGLGESVVEERIAPALKPLLALGLEIGYCARMGEVDLRFSAFGERAKEVVAEAETAARSILGLAVFGSGDETLETFLIRALTERGETLAVAESCTGGLIGHRLTNVPGASAVLLADLVTYSNEAKTRFLGVSAETLSTHGAVSEETAREMAAGARLATGATHAIAVTGVAGPSGGSPGKPAGTVFIAAATGGTTEVRKQYNPFDRETFKLMASQQALDLLRRHLPAKPSR